MTLRDVFLTKGELRELDAMPVGTLMSLHADFTVTPTFASGMGYWRQGDAPTIVLDPPSAQVAGRCVASRVRGFPFRDTATIHPRTCRWCATPTEELLRALDHATFVSRFVSGETVAWPTKGDPYVRDSGLAGRYENPAWAAFFALGRDDRAFVVERAWQAVAA